MHGAGYCEVEHTADWELEAWAPDFPGLLEQAARGMYRLAGIQAQPGGQALRELLLVQPDRESRLVGFLRELLYLAESEHLAFDGFAFTQAPGGLHASLAGGTLLSQAKEIKAVTYHNLRVQDEENGLRVNIVFDV